MGSPVVHFEVIGSDAAPLQRFYAELFDWKLGTNLPYELVDTEAGSGINGGVGATDQAEHRGVRVYAEVEDLDAHLVRAERLGATIVQQPTEVAPGTKVAMFDDPQGNRFGLVSSS
jgi:uncharacterized protein